MYLLNMLHMHKRCFEVHVRRPGKRTFFLAGWRKQSMFVQRVLFQKNRGKDRLLIIQFLFYLFYSRDLWDSEQLSQIAGSQGSQNSSSDMFSQSRMSQLKGLSSLDVWSQPSNSQQLVEVFFSLFDHEEVI